MNDVRDRRVLVVGLATSGRAVVRALLGDGARVRAVEARTDAEVDDLRAAGAEVRLGPHGDADLDGIDLVIPSPGVPERAPILGAAMRRGVPIWSELEYGGRRTDAPMLAITGTNGKSTTTELVTAMLVAAGLRARACGNIGHPLVTAADEDVDVLVVEASSFQLRFCETFRPRVSVITNLAPDHLDWHGDLDAYATAKARIHAAQVDGDVHIGNRDDALARAVSARARCAIRWFGTSQPADGEVGWDGDALVARVGGGGVIDGLPEGGHAWREDLAAAAAASLAFGVDAAAVADGARAMRRLPHRGEEVARVDGVRFLDDSKATNVHAALAALRGRRDVVLIAGGLAKGVDLTPLAAATDALVGVVAIGEAAGEIERVFAGRVPVRRAGSIEEAVTVAAGMAPSDGTVLLAPACASWDMFRDYVERGERFAAAARAMGEVRRGA